MKRKYTTNIINNINSINPKIWGKAGWIFLFSIALTYEFKNKDFYKIFFISIENILPCNSCRKNYKKHINDLNDTVFNNKENLLNWLLNIKNEIAIENKQPIITLDDMLNEIYNNNKKTIDNEIIDNEIIDNEKIDNEIIDNENIIVKNIIVKKNKINKFVNVKKIIFFVVIVFIIFLFFKVFH